MNEKIKRLLQELKEECEKNSVSAVCAVRKGKETSTVIAGDLAGIAICLAKQEQVIDEGLPVPAERLRMNALNAMDPNYKAKQPDHIFAVDNIDDFQDIINRIKAGEFR